MGFNLHSWCYRGLSPPCVTSTTRCWGGVSPPSALRCWGGISPPRVLLGGGNPLRGKKPQRRALWGGISPPNCTGHVLCFKQNHALVHEVACGHPRNSSKLPSDLVGIRRSCLRSRRRLRTPSEFVKNRRSCLLTSSEFGEIRRGCIRTS